MAMNKTCCLEKSSTAYTISIYKLLLPSYILWRFMELDKNIFISQPAAAEAHRLNLAEGQVERKIQEVEHDCPTHWKLEGLQKKNGF